MRKIKITKAIAGAPDHMTTRDYQPNEEYEVGHPHMPEFLAETLLRDGYAEEVGHVKGDKLVEKAAEKIEKPSLPAGFTTPRSGSGRFEKKA